MSQTVIDLMCGRVNCKATARPGFSFCSPCLAWLRGDDDHDPLARPEPASLKVPSLVPPPQLAEVDDGDWAWAASATGWV